MSAPTKEYAKVNGTSYDPRTPHEVAVVLETARARGFRIRVHYGDTETGRDWMDRYHVTGRVGRSCGPVKIPVLVHNKSSMGGPGILDHCIVRIRHANRKDGGDLYRHPDYHLDPARLVAERLHGRDLADFR